MHGRGVLRVYLLGTGSPSPSATRQGIATLIDAGGTWLLFDTGRATLQRMHECGIPIERVTDVFYTHLHSDHIVGFADLWMTGWFVSGRAEPMHVWGPRGTQRFIAGVKEAHHFDLQVRPNYESADAAGLGVNVTEFDTTTTLDRDGIRVTAFPVDHGPHVKPAFGFRIEYAGRAVVISGDTTYCETLVRHAAGADLLVHELVAASAEAVASDPQLSTIMAIHTTPEQIAEICTRARPRATLLNHLSLWGQTPADVLARVALTYPGLVAVAEDRMEVVVGETIEIVAPRAIPGVLPVAVPG